MSLLALRPVANHSGEKQFVTLLPVLRDFGILRRIGSVVGDNSSTNDTLCRASSTCLREEEDIDWDPEVHRLRCLGHVINLAVQAFLFKDSLDLNQCELYDDSEGHAEIQKQRAKFRLLGPLGKLHNLVVNIRSSSGRTKEFKELAGRLIPLDNRTRWNSWYQMLQVATEQGIASALDSYTKNHFDDLSADFLLPEEWVRLRTIKDILQPFSRATLATQGDHATLDKVLFTMDVLIRCFDEIAYKSDPELSSRIQRGWEVFDKYYSKTDSSPYYAAALILHPSYRKTYIYANWKKKWHKPAFKQVKDLWLAYRDATDADALSHHLVDDGGDKDLDAFDRISRNLQNCTRPSSQDEYEDYISYDPYDITPMTALSWWLQEQQRKRWPRLSRMAIDILSMPAMSDEPERVFSGTRRTISWERAQLDADQVEKGECLKQWVRNDTLKGCEGGEVHVFG
ncbi:ribonuclease H-like protein [Pochonia chlamydosporia 170]|uniref:Ribonuclease H-like protein n=1 Tax=Pochonia chlamydosporia 170 TaxID=1380566 RepID=A0A179EYG8_METCM|nr:ribonuclease H-like protein [Pochonia chlamydosporia 170]OAQ58218.1 ribonuclease H-like protein [Pochonia chlamydosporia 170]